MLGPQVAPTAAARTLPGGRAFHTTHRPAGYPDRDVALLHARHGRLAWLDFHQLDRGLVGRSLTHWAPDSGFGVQARVGPGKRGAEPKQERCCRQRADEQPAPVAAEVPVPQQDEHDPACAERILVDSVEAARAVPSVKSIVIVTVPEIPL